MNTKRQVFFPVKEFSETRLASGPTGSIVTTLTETQQGYGSITGMDYTISARSTAQLDFKLNVTSYGANDIATIQALLVAAMTTSGRQQYTSDSSTSSSGWWVFSNSNSSSSSSSMTSYGIWLVR